jgi:integrase
MQTSLNKLPGICQCCAQKKDAKREELISHNVAELVTLPRSRKRTSRRIAWTVDEARSFLESVPHDNDPLYPLWVLILVLGIRRGEGLGMVADAVDEEKAEVFLE